MDVIDKRVQELHREELIKELNRDELIKQIHVGLALVEDRRGLVKANQREFPQERRRGQTFAEKKDGPNVVNIFGGRNLLETKLQDLVERNADIEQLRSLLRQLPLAILQSVSGKGREGQNDLAKYLGVVEDQSDQKPLNKGQLIA